MRIVSGGTDCHMLLLDLRGKNITGKDAEDALGRAHMTVNKNAIPNDPQKPTVTSRRAHRLAGDDHARLRRGGGRAARRPDRRRARAIPRDEANLQRVTREVKALCAKFPVYV